MEGILPMRIEELEVSLTAFGDGERVELASWSSGNRIGPVRYGMTTEIVDGQELTAVTISWVEKGNDDAE